MVRDAAATRARILGAAIEEFSACGLAGARIERIGAASGANPRSIYAYYTNKEQLFNAALHQVITDLVAEVPLTEDDLPGYAGRMFDYHLAHPQAARMSAWRQLERPAAGPDAGEIYAEKIKKMAALPATGLPPTDLIVLVMGLASSWMLSPDDLLTADGSDPHSAQRLAVHRAAIVEAARRLCAPPGPGGGGAGAAEGRGRDGTGA